MYLFDTNILSEVLKKRPDQGLLERLSGIPGHLQFTSCICVMELRYGSRRRPDHENFWKKIEDKLLSQVKTLPIARDTALIAGDIAANLSLDGRGISPEDLLIAATAVEKGVTLITANQRHFRDIEGLKIENWMNNSDTPQ
jgi:tRNA(fMet)-specific endonuclease VapC